MTVAGPYQVIVQVGGIEQRYPYRTAEKAREAFTNWKVSSKKPFSVKLISPLGKLLDRWEQAP